jgi:hypothetical protein
MIAKYEMNGIMVNNNQGSGKRKKIKTSAPVERVSSFGI